MRPLPAYIVTWWMVPGFDGSVAKNSRSPGRRREYEIFCDCVYCAREECGSETPARCQARIVRPEQS